MLDTLHGKLSEQMESAMWGAFICGIVLLPAAAILLATGAPQTIANTNISGNQTLGESVTHPQSFVQPRTTDSSLLVYHYSTAGSGFGIALTDAKPGEISPMLVYDLESGGFGVGYGMGI